MRHDLLLLTATILLLAGCATVEPLGDRSADAVPLPRNLAERFCYQRAPLENTLELRKEKRRYRVYDVVLEAGPDEYADDTPITLEYYEPIADTPVATVLVLPILNGQKELVRPFATQFAKHGYAAVIVDTVQRRTLIEDLVNPESAIRLTVLRHRRVIDWVVNQPQLDASRLAVFGASLGGFNALYVAALDPRIRAVVPALVAGDLPYVLVHSNERRIAESVETTRQSLSMTAAEFQAYLEEHLETDLLTLAPHINADRVLMVLAKHDKAVPYEKQVELRKALGDPQAIYLPTGHITTAAYLFYLRSRALRFFERKFAEPGNRSVQAVSDDYCAAIVQEGG